MCHFCVCLPHRGHLCSFLLHPIVGRCIFVFSPKYHIGWSQIVRRMLCEAVLARRMLRKIGCGASCFKTP